MSDGRSRRQKIQDDWRFLKRWGWLVLAWLLIPLLSSQFAKYFDAHHSSFWVKLAVNVAGAAAIGAIGFLGMMRIRHDADTKARRVARTKS